MNRISRYVVLVVMVGGGVVVSLAIAAPPPQAAAVKKVKVFRKGSVPFQLYRPAEAAAPQLKQGPDKLLRVEDKVNVLLDREDTPHEIAMKAEHQAVSAGGRLSLSVTDNTTSRQTQYVYEPAANSITLRTGGASVTVTKNPDGRYSVDHGPAVTGKAAVAQLKAKQAYKEASPHGMLAAYAAAQQGMPETRVPSQCVSWNARRMTATGPAVCTIFQDLCDCMACDATGQPGSCAECR